MEDGLTSCHLQHWHWSGINHTLEHDLLVTHLDNTCDVFMCGWTACSNRLPLCVCIDSNVSWVPTRATQAHIIMWQFTLSCFWCTVHWRTALTHNTANRHKHTSWFMNHTVHHHHELQLHTPLTSMTWLWTLRHQQMLPQILTNL